MKKIYAMIAAAMAAMSASADTTQEWVRIGTGAFTDFVVSSIYDYSTKPIEAEFEQNVSDPNTYRIRQPYANWTDWRAEGLTYDASKATPMVIHVVDNLYATIESFDTGLMIDTADAYGPIVGVISVVPAAGARCTYDEGTITLTEYVGGSPSIRIDVSGEPIWRGNKDGVLKVQLPTAKDLDPKFKWNKMEGKALFTDGLTSLFAYRDTPQFPVFEVEMQQNEDDPTVYRLVNPYAAWNVPYSSYDFEYDADNDYYMTVYTFPEQGLACTGNFYTGLNVKIKGSEDPFEMFGVQSQAYYFYTDYASTFGWYLSEVAEEFGYMFGTLADGVITYPGSYEDTYEGQIMEFPMFTGWTGPFDVADANNQVYVVNKEGQFKIVFPKGETTGVESPAVGEDGPEEYYTLSGVKVARPVPGQIVIRVKNGKAVKVVK